MEDIIVTLLDGTKVKKSEVPVGVIYINEKGQKVRKVVKVVKTVTTPQQPKTEQRTFFGSIAQTIRSGAVTIRDGVASAVVTGSSKLIQTTKKVAESIGKAKESAGAFLDSMMAKLMEKMQIEKTIKTLEEYQQSSGKDIHDLIDFLKKLQTVESK